MKIVYFLPIIFLLYSCSNNQTNPKKPDLAISEPVTDSYWGIKISDPYRNLEKLDDSLVQKWFKSQANYSDEILSSISGRDSLVKKMKELDSRYSYSIKKTRLTDNAEYFYLKKELNDKYYKLYYRATFTSKEELIFNPENFKQKSKKNYTINYIQPSWNGKFIALALSYDGKELSELVIVDMEKRKVLPEIIPNTWPSSFLGVNWLPDSSGFTYLHFPITDSTDKNFKKNTKSVLYHLGQDPDKLNIILSSETHPNFGITSGDFPATKIKSSKDKYIVGYLAGVNNYWKGYYLELNDLKIGKLNWKPLITSNDGAFRSSGFFNNDQFIYKSVNGSSKFKISSRDISSDSIVTKDLVPEFNDETIREFTMTQNGLYFTTLKNGVEAKLYHRNNDQISEIELPKKSGNIYLQSIGNELNELWIYTSGWTSDELRYNYNTSSKTFALNNIIADSRYPEFENLVVKEVEVISHDGVKVPLSIIYDKKRAKRKDTPLLIDGYGAYGSNMSPYFSPIILSWVLEGGVFCTAHVRGGGEKGDAWHKAGQKTTKPNTWKDLIATAKYLIKENYTSKEHLTIFSSSAGGIMVGRALTEAPDLFAASIVQVGMMNPLRSEAMPGEGGANYKEYGSVKDSIECKALIEMDPYLHIKSGTQYPATFLTGAMNDTRVSPWIPGKFIARLQESGTKKPVIFDVKYDEGHNGGSNSDNVYEEWANIYSFAFWQTGHPDYQPKK